MIADSTLAAPRPLAGNCSPDLSALNDDQLLTRFFTAREDAAFSLLLERHGPLVYGVCRRVLGDASDAEDAFQATFLVLVRKGGSLRDPARLASWLYGVAYRTACKAKGKAALRTRSERQASEMPTTKMPKTAEAGDMTLEELRSILDDEISRLPEKYALPLVLCYLEGKTNAEAAAQLGWPEGSISRRLSRARELLKSRLAKRGLALSAALIAAVFSRHAIAAVPCELLQTTTRAASLMAQGTKIGEVVSPSTAQLVDDVFASMSASSKFVVPAFAALLAVLLLVSVAVWQFGTPAYAASLFQFSRRSSPHALTTTGGISASPQIVVGTGCGAPVASGCGAPGVSATPSCQAAR